MRTKVYSCGDYLNDVYFLRKAADITTDYTTDDRDVEKKRQLIKLSGLDKLVVKGGRSVLIEQVCSVDQINAVYLSQVDRARNRVKKFEEELSSRSELERKALDEFRAMRDACSEEEAFDHDEEFCRITENLPDDHVLIILYRQFKARQGVTYERYV